MSTLSAGQTVTTVLDSSYTLDITPATNGLVRAVVSRAGKQICGDSVKRGARLGPFLMGDRVSLTAERGAATYWLNPGAAALSAPDGPVIISHRWGAGQGDSTCVALGPWPENSLEGGDAALAYGINTIETDVRLDSQGTPWIFHDPTLDRMTSGTGDILLLTTAQVRALVLELSTAVAPGWKNTTLITLDEFLARFGQRVIGIYEAKATDINVAAETARVIVSRLLAHNIPTNRAFVSSFDLSVLQAVGGAYPTIRYIDDMTGYSEANVAANAAAGVSSISAFTGWTPVITNLVHTYGMTAGVSLISRRHELAASVAAGCDWVITDEPVYITGKARQAKSNLFAGGKWPHGIISSVATAGGRGQVTVLGEWQFVWLYAASPRFSLVGPFGFVSGALTLDITVKCDVPSVSNSAIVVVNICCPTDIKNDGSGSGASRFAPGYEIKLRRNQNYQIYRNEANGLTQTLLAEKAAGSALAGTGTVDAVDGDKSASAGTGTPYAFRITRDPVTGVINVYNLTASASVAVTATDTTYPEGYVQVGRVGSTATITALAIS